ncbi:hypothetical protein [Paraburkholderia tropica]|uniref:hypothetical protein n=1 Tax=Paraburkholderia tropica TaxID=92647 RepID=UPI003D2CC88E
MAAIAKVCAAVFGTSGVVNGLAATPTSPATMAIQIGAGEVYQLAPYEATACGTLPQNTATNLLKQGIQLANYTTPTFAAPTTSGQSIAYLVECQYQDADISLDPTSLLTPVVLQFYNSTNPSTPWSGPNNSGATSNTFRDGVVAYQIKAGVAATTGSQVTPSPDTGWIGLWVVTVPYGATSLTSSNISQYTGSPILPTGILQSIITSNLTYGVDSGTAGIVQAKFPIPVTTLVDGMDVWVKIAAANTSTATFTPNPGVISAAPIVGAAHAALQGGELVAGGRANFVWRADITSWVLVECTGGALQVAPATASQHAPQMAQAAGVVGSVRNLAMTVSTASATATLTADEIIVETALGGVRYCLPSFSKTINLSTTGAGGMDTGTAPVSGYVALYAIYNPTTGTAALLATNATSAAQPNVYGGANMPSGYTASALVSVWPTNSSSQFVIGYQRDRVVQTVGAFALSSSATHASLTSLSITGCVPPNAKSISGQLQISSTSASNMSITIAADANGAGQQNISAPVAASSVSTISSFSRMLLATPQTIYYTSGSSAGTPSFLIFIDQYEI